MQELHVHIEADGADPAVQRLQEPLEAQLSSALQRAAEVIQHDYHGESVEEVSHRLLDIARSSLHPDIANAWLPDEDELRQAAEAIVRDFH
ncbi:hypothetical protein [Dactylosporangium matsuzakiense]|uniref:Uncharacterized protein n=1 Tax=Dactylosporangium matsuzakiense TaxID=53360 RepID=A0A9W6KT69_9ACTN|nr:hypothetical protein [Dactylosporangium matsuzakiense]UWZ44803.1 hypothetical protein Dmats_47080 [Dactylosporangium matsuzakiense]GLL06066.1 hypothetical protein GCM10017581_078140 [Dactylosporangium matsuzakiense]